MVGFTVIAPCASRSRIRLETVGWDWASLWSGSGSPYLVIFPVTAAINGRALAHRAASGSPLISPNWSKGTPNRYLGSTCAPRRTDRVVEAAK